MLFGHSVTLNSLVRTQTSTALKVNRGPTTTTTGWQVGGSRVGSGELRWSWPVGALWGSTGHASPQHVFGKSVDRTPDVIGKIELMPDGSQIRRGKMVAIISFDRPPVIYLSWWWEEHQLWEHVQCQGLNEARPFLETLSDSASPSFSFLNGTWELLRIGLETIVFVFSRSNLIECWIRNSWCCQFNN